MQPPTLNPLLFYNIMQLATLKVDQETTNSMDSIQTHYEPLTNLLVTQSRSPGIQACHDLLAIVAHGRFTVTCTSKTDDQIACQVEQRQLNYEFLSDLRGSCS